LIHSIGSLPAVLADVFRSAFTGHAAVGGFAGSSFMLAIQYGLSKAAYSSDIGIGYDSVIQSESRTVRPEKQGHLAILGVLIDNLICTFTILVVLISGAWKAIGPLQGSEVIQTALSAYFPYMQFFVPFFLFITGYTTIIAFLIAGIKCARYISPRWGKRIYIFYAILSFICFSFLPQNQVILVMSLSGALLLIINLLGIFRLRHEISFTETEEVPITVHEKEVYY
ncbi:MAG: alanine:cation symporter family protein, partial [Chlamydiales bacterium]